MLTRRGLVLSSMALPLAQALPGVARAAEPIRAKLRLSERRVTIDAMLNGRGPYPLLLDTGAVVSGVENSLAQALGLRKLRDVRLNRGETFPLYAVDDLVLGGQVRQAGAAMAGFKLGDSEIRGLLAAGTITAIDSELDFEREEWRLYPGGGVDRTGYTRLDAEFNRYGSNEGSQVIRTDLIVGGLKVNALWDTGAPLPLILDFASGRKLGLWSDAVPYAPMKIRGVAGFSRKVARVVRGPDLRIGQAVYESPLIVVQAPDEHEKYTVLGLPIIRTLNLSAEPAAKSLWIARNRLSPTRPRYPRSGVWVEAQKGVVSIDELGSGSPAAKAGVRKGDVILGAATVDEALAMLNRRDGETVTLRLKRGDQTVDAGFVLSDWL